MDLGSIRFGVARLYAQLYGLSQKYLHRNLRGIGYAMRLINRDRILIVNGIKLYLNANIATCYIPNVAGSFSEQETHKFLQTTIKAISKEVLIVDVGANIGEMVMDVARFSNVRMVKAFEPNPECVKACRLGVELNKYKNVEIISKVVSNEEKTVQFFLSEDAPVTSSIVAKENRHPVEYEATTLDKELENEPGLSIIIIDVEGAETLVLHGAKGYVAKNLPLILFEYNDCSRRFFSLGDVRAILGSGYTLYRLRDDGLLDERFDETWNCVAVSLASPFYPIMCSLLFAS